MGQQQCFAKCKGTKNDDPLTALEARDKHLNTDNVNIDGEDLTQQTIKNPADMAAQLVAESPQTRGDPTAARRDSVPESQSLE